MPTSSAAGQTRQPDGRVFRILEYRFADRVFVGRYEGFVAGERISFEEVVDFGETGGDARPHESLLRLLALTLSLSYYKATLSDEIAVDFPLSAAETAFLRTVTEHGLGEYAYVNDLPWKLTPTVTAPPREASDASPSPLTTRPLVAVGGGKDSIVTIEALKATGHKPLLFSVNDRGAIRASVEVSGCEFFTVSRRIDPRLVRANADGAPNGHVPVTAMNSLIGLIAAELAGCGPVIFSNEASADYGNLDWLGRHINHQWSKSLEYEDLLRETLAAEGLSPERFFSLLRGYREIEITRDFSRHEQYFDAFTSCNRAYRIDPGARSAGWCGECPKCVFVFLLLAPFVPRAQLVSIFGRDILDEPGQRQHLLDILGIGTQKPFECVGEPSEAVEALTLVDRGGQWHGSALVSELVAQAGAVEPARGIRGLDRVPSAFQDARDRIGLP